MAGEFFGTVKERASKGKNYHLSMKYFVSAFHFDTGKGRSEVTQNAHFILNDLIGEDIRTRHVFQSIHSSL